MERAPVLPITTTLNTMPNHAVTLTLSNNRISKRKAGLFSGLSLLERLPGPMLPPETVLMPTVCTADGDCVDAYGPCC